MENSNQIPSIVNYEHALSNVEAFIMRNQKLYFRFVEASAYYFVILAAIYCIVIFSIKYYLKDKEPYNLRLFLACWSGFLAIFSGIGAARTLPELVHIIREHSFFHSLCDPGLFYGSSSVWTILFHLSKPIELGDTIFIVLRKQKLIFLHWYHHISVMIYVCFAFKVMHSPGRWFIAMNFTVHTFMYTYYALRALRIRMPKLVNMCITSMQLLQMVIGLSLHIYLMTLSAEMKCHCSTHIIYAGILMYLSYFILFAKFFADTYIFNESFKTIRHLSSNASSNDSNGNLSCMDKKQL